MDWWRLIIDIAQVLTGVAAVTAIFLTRRGWKEAAKTANEQALQESVMATNYDIYKDILAQVNTIMSKNSQYTTNLNSHVDSTALLLNEWHGLGAFETFADPERKLELAGSWSESSRKIVSDAYDLQLNALNLTRMLDMSGADFGSDSKVYNALWLVYGDLNDAIVKVQNKWTNLELENISVKQYDWLKNDTQAVIKEAQEFGSCVDDILKHVYNKLVAQPMRKTPKAVDMSEKRRIVTIDGLRDNRVENAS